jgi:hypothetical protein
LKPVYDKISCLFTAFYATHTSSGGDAENVKNLALMNTDNTGVKRLPKLAIARQCERSVSRATTVG